MDRTKPENFEEDHGFSLPIQVEPNKVQVHHHESQQIYKDMASP